jgi:uncharacterized coiled-coil DUF342 family protein
MSSDEIKRLRETRDELYERVSDLHTALEAAEKERDELKARVEELEERLREVTDSAMCRRMFMQEKGMGSAYVDWRQARGIDGESLHKKETER